MLGPPAAIPRAARRKDTRAMATLAGDDIRALVRPGRVHRRVYTDEAIFELELERIFGRAWIYVGHESQIKKPGDFLATRIGRKPLLLVRDRDGRIQLVHNQCAHRGAMVVASEGGHTDEFRCCYHGWTYHLDGRLKAAPLLHDYPPHFDASDPAIGMQRVPRVASYRGFVFASLSPEGPSLEEFLGYMTTSFDDMVDRAPDGELDVAGGVFKHRYKGNWKLYLENLCDAAHPLFVHQSSIDAAQAQSDAAHSDGSGEIAIRQMRQNGAPYSFWEAKVGIWAYPNGHSFLGDYHDDAKLVAALNDPIFRDYVAALEAKKGKAEAKRILDLRRWNSNVHPNLSFMSQFQQLRVVHPISVNETVVHTYTFRLKGAPEEMFRNAVAFANIVNGTGSLVLTDDLEIYNRVEFGLRSAGSEWLEIGRGYRGDAPDEHGGRRGKNSTSEVYIRNMLDAWVALMSDDGRPARRVGGGAAAQAAEIRP
jgi:phenylpropionate dioxygenase-like ring-hydroxylating dioxygenase large terminal subunit